MHVSEDVLQEVLEKGYQKLKADVIFANEENNLEDILEKYSMLDLVPRGCYQEEDTEENQGRILIVGMDNPDRDMIKSVCKAEGISFDLVDICSEKKTAKNLNVNDLQYSKKYSVVFVGPMPHNTRGVAGYSSSITRMETEEGFPGIVRIQEYNGTLKTTKSAFRKALQEAKTRQLIAA